MKRVLIGGILGGLTFFFWTWISHTVLPIGVMGISSLPNEQALLEPMKQQLREAGFYFFPGMDMSRKLSDEEMKAWEEKHRTGPAGILVYQPQGGESMSPKRLITQALTDLISGLIIAIVISFVAASYGMRVFLVTLMGLFSWIAIELPYWNWYCFPGAFVIGGGIDQVAGWFIAGLVLSAFVRSKREG